MVVCFKRSQGRMDLQLGTMHNFALLLTLQFSLCHLLGDTDFHPSEQFPFHFTTASKVFFLD